MRARYAAPLVLALFAVAAAACDRSVVDLEGRHVDPLAHPSGADLTVLLFTSPTCPIANRYAPEIRRLAERFGQGVAWYLVYPDASADEARAHRDEYQLRLPALRDPRHTLARRAHVDVTPEAALFRDGALVWHGRIDDRWADLGHERPSATRHDLEEALAALQAGRAPPLEAPAVGCALSPLP
jgi:hypothetical protein